ncbi:hypothetical protein [Tateyamaria sp. syn59]|uniref:hypothetical protein n=1 Tax=Tateyamaria sp. syn59 TaxID=2576942 RepID=UPI0011BE1A38|nr:hypothetical protein [Tateyamaria sp. syn59]
MVLPGAVRAEVVSIVVNRAATHTELYISAEAETLFRAFGADTQIVPKHDDRVDYAAFAGGTWGIGDALIADAVIEIDQSPVRPEAMSFMLHPSGDALAFETPLDGMVAIGVCNALSSDATYYLAELSGYAGYFADVGSVEATLELTLATPTASDLTVRVFDFGSGQQTKSLRYFEPGANVTLTLAAPGSYFAFGHVLMYALILLISAVLSAWTFAIWRGRTEKRIRSQSHFRPRKSSTSAHAR